jgi:DNA-binding MarR family transcriptional regulator
MHAKIIVVPQEDDFYDDRSNSLGYLTRVVYAPFTRNLELRTAALGVSSAHWPLLRVLWHGDGMTQAELSRRASLRISTTIAAVKSLEEAGLARREPCDEDRRKVRVFLTLRAHRVRRAMMACVAEVNELAARGVDAEDLATTRRVLAKMRENLNQAEFDDGSPGSSN